MDEISKILNKFNPVSLSQIKEVKLMNRIDRKYWFHISDLDKILIEALKYYNILEINGQRLMAYETTYYDTPDDLMYRLHHNRKLNRYKIRKRRYLSTQKDFLEIKLKNNKRRTLKERIESSSNGKGFSDEEIHFIMNNSPYQGKQLSTALKNRFRRITLVSKTNSDRCTIDTGLEFINEAGRVKFDDLAVVEIKRGRSLKSSPLLAILRGKKIRQRGLSKYCTGRAILDPELRQNAFKPRLRYLKNRHLNID